MFWVCIVFKNVFIEIFLKFLVAKWYTQRVVITHFTIECWTCSAPIVNANRKRRFWPKKLSVCRARWSFASNRPYRCLSGWNGWKNWWNSPLERFIFRISLLPMVWSISGLIATSNVDFQGEDSLISSPVYFRNFKIVCYDLLTKLYLQ